ncbi:GGDEF domain-containing protein [Paenibacillus sp. FSL W8-1187]|uniref:sensor domain-containing diguanylate cyclase n=1 Tax=unclassified Paenibacillus TaxID=185978 RepID=UPI00129A1716|nr:GGDEF domain-containing protein [Paenibacillus sp. B01]QGG56573.1 diguanylate cyclase [Paenibacillus sp. B01]
MTDRMTTQLLQLPSSAKQRTAAAVSAALLAAISIAALPFGQHPIGTIQPFLPAFIAWFIFADLLTAHLLFSQYRAAGSRATLVLAATYLYSGLIIVPHILTFPGVFSENGLFGAGPQTSVWLWTLWHAGFPIGLIAYLAVARFERGRPPGRGSMPLALLAGAASIALVTALTLVALLAHDHLPILLDESRFTPLLSQGIGPVIWLFSAIALVLLWTLQRGRTVLNLWLTVAMLAFMLDITLTVFAGARYSLGWYLARVNSLVSAFAIICAIIYEVNRLYVRLARHQEDLLQTQEELHALNDELSRLSQLDGLTGIANRRRFDELLARHLTESRRTGAPFSLLLLDIDFFKAYNDHYGHQQGDRILKQTARLIEDRIAPGPASAARYGGEEFAVLLPGSGSHDAVQAAEAIRRAIEEAAMLHEQSRVAPSVTLSIGVASIETGQPREETRPAAAASAAGAAAAGKSGAARDSAAGAASPDSGEGSGATAEAAELIGRADRALYRSKDAGRNRVTLDEGTGSSSFA